MARAARAAGYDVLGFSSHAPLVTPTPWAVPPERLEAYAAEIRRLRADWAEGGAEALLHGPMEILLGLEVDWYPGERAPGDGAFGSLALDYSIGSVHAVGTDGQGLFTIDGPADELDRAIAEKAGGEPRRVWKAYYEALSRMIEAGGFDILGHFDLVKKNNPGGRLFDEEDPAYLAAAFEAAGLLEGKGIVAELNLGGLARGKTKEPYPSLPILRELKRLRVPVTFCADAHDTRHVGVHLDAARELARAAGYESVAVLTKGSWIEVGIDET